MECSFYLPPELWDYIFKFLPIKKMIRLNLVSRFFNEIIELNRNFKCKILLFKNEKENKTPKEQFQWACYKGYLEVCKWLISTFNLTIKDVRSRDNLALRCAYENGHSKVCKWLKETFKI